MYKPVAVVISDVHYNINTLEVADKAMNLAIDKANELEVPLIVNGDLHDTKANMRAECVTTMLKTFNRCKLTPKILMGNHDKVNEKSQEHALDFLNETARVISNPEYSGGWYFIPYQHDPDTFKKILSDTPIGSTVFCHQGVIGSSAGYYLKDSSAVPLEWFEDYRAISGHYHTRQQLFCKGPSVFYPHDPYRGVFDYVGNPYSLGFGEANDPEKGFQILYDDGHLEFVPINLRKHVIYECFKNTHWISDYKSFNDNDILWIKAEGPSDWLSTVNKTFFKEKLGIQQDFKLDLIPTDTEVSKQETKSEQTQSEILDTLIDGLKNTDDRRKLKLKDLWKKLS